MDLLLWIYHENYWLVQRLFDLLKSILKCERKSCHQFRKILHLCLFPRSTKSSISRIPWVKSLFTLLAAKKVKLWKLVHWTHKNTDILAWKLTKPSHFLSLPNQYHLHQVNLNTTKFVALSIYICWIPVKRTTLTNYLQMSYSRDSLTENWSKQDFIKHHT